MVVPFAIYLAQATRKWLWWLAVALLILGALATSWRTAITMLASIFIVYLVTRVRISKVWPAIIPALLVTHLAVPGAIGSTYKSFFPRGGLIAEQKDAPSGSARISSLWPALHNEVAKDPLFGEGFATRVTVPDRTTPVPNAPILDDNWLGLLCETGIAGVLSLGWLFVRFVRRLLGASRRDESPRGWLLVGAAASVTAYAVGMFTYDAFAFIQVTFVFFITLGIGAATLRVTSREWD